MEVEEELLILQAWQHEFDQQLTWEQTERLEEVVEVEVVASYSSFEEALAAYIEVVEHFADVVP